jgi:cephalosporin hydroxylase
MLSEVRHRLNAMRLRLETRSLRKKIRSCEEEHPAFDNLDSLIDFHFRVFSAPSHVNKTGMAVALRQLRETPSLILETGTSAWGTDSSRLWASYVRSFGGVFATVDIRTEPALALSDLNGTAEFHVGDSVQFLQNYEIPNGFSSVDLVYLDSWDLDLADPAQSMEHGLAEWKATQRLIGTGSVVVIDDTPIEASLLGPLGLEFFRAYGFVPGKGALILQERGLCNDFEVIYHHYNLVLVKK